MSSRQHNESGLVSIVIVTTIVILLSLVSVGFSKIMDREARQALDRQLSLQAYYAAESGANDVINKLQDDPNFTGFSSCGAQPEDANFTKQVFAPADADSVAKYTCLLVNTGVGDIVFGDLNQDQQKAYLVNTGFSRLQLSWDTDGGNVTNLRGDSQLPPVTSWNSNAGAIRLSIYSDIGRLTGGRGTIDTQIAELGNRTFFILPSSGVFNGMIDSASCPASGITCTASVDFPLSPASGQSLIVVKGLYKDIKNLRVTSLGVNLDAQVEVDVTGQANDSVRRIKVRIPTHPLDASGIPSFALQTDGDLCKRWRVPVDPAQPITQNCN